MAEIPIQRKERSRLWPLLLLVLIVAAILIGWYVWSHHGGGTQTSALTDSTAVQTSNGAMVTDSASHAGRPPQ